MVYYAVQLQISTGFCHRFSPYVFGSTFRNQIPCSHPPRPLPSAWNKTGILLRQPTRKWSTLEVQERTPTLHGMGDSLSTRVCCATRDRIIHVSE